MIAPKVLYGTPLPKCTPEYALAYAELGLRIVPVHGVVRGSCTCGMDCGRNAGKHPVAALARRGVKDAVALPSTLAAWWHAWPEANVGLACGSVSRIVVVDSDGEAGVAELTRRGYPATWTARSGAGGLHVYFEAPGHPVGNWRIRGVGDLRADGGYVVAPPSRHRCGGRYEWLPGLSPWEVGLATAPEWVPLGEPRTVAPVVRPVHTGSPLRLPRLSRRMRDLIRHGNRGEYPSRSEADFAACVAMFGAGYTDAEVWAVMADPTNGISAKYREKGRQGERYLSLTISKALAVALPARSAGSRRGTCSVGVRPRGARPDASRTAVVRFV